MDITEFIITLSQSPDRLSGIFVYTLSADLPCRVLFTELVHYFKKQRYPQGTLVCLDGEIQTLDTVLTQVTAPFLMPGVCSIKNAHVLIGKTKNYYRDFLREYTGPHSFFVHEHTAEKEIAQLADAHTLTITAPDKVTAEFYDFCARQLYTITDAVFVDRLFSKCGALSYDQAFLLLSYQRILGNKALGIVAQWFDKVCEPEYSLFTLSSHLFAGQRTLFFTLWANISREYGPEFWVPFWAEQLWQASIFITIQQKYGLTEAKKSVSRLPFSFMHKDWRRYSCAQLTQAHTALCALDSSLKGGTGLYVLEHWFYTFFSQTLK
jgi:hypothetical protein